MVWIGSVGASISAGPCPILYLFDPRLFGAAFVGEGPLQLWPRRELGFEFVQPGPDRRSPSRIDSLGVKPPAGAGPASSDGRGVSVARAGCAAPVRQRRRFDQSSWKSLGKLTPHLTGPSKLDFQQHPLAGARMHLTGWRGVHEIAREFRPTPAPRLGPPVVEPGALSGKKKFASPSRSPLRRARGVCDPTAQILGVQLARR